MSEDINYIDIKEFREKGYLQEVNRKFFHVLGLALEIIQEDDGTERIGGIWDYREDTEGVFYVDGVIDPEKTKYVSEEWDKKAFQRQVELGYVVQPVV